MANLQLLAQKHKKYVEKIQNSTGKPEATKDGLDTLLNQGKKYFPLNTDKAINEFEGENNPSGRIPEREDIFQADVIKTISPTVPLPMKELFPSRISSLKGSLPTGEDSREGTAVTSTTIIKLIERKFGLDALRLLGGHDLKFLMLLHNKAKNSPEKFVRVSRKELEEAGVKTARISIIREKLSGQFKNKSEKRFFPYEIIKFNADKIDEKNRGFTEYKLNI